MVAEVDLRPLGTVARVRSGFAFSSEDMGSLGVPIIKIKNLVPPTVDLSECERVPEHVITRIPNADRFELEEGDTLIAMTGATVGKVGRFPRAHERYFLNQRVGKVYLTAPDAADYRYLYYVLSQDAYVRQMFGVADGSAQANISGSQIEKLEIPLPPIAEQKAIAAMLGALDDKIELNRRMNATLEAMARALFQSWFVDFDPVRAKLDGRDPANAALFPNEFEDSEFGPIPKGWSVGKISDSFDLTMGQSPPGETYNEDGKGVPFYQGRADFGFRFPTRRIFCTAPARYAKPGDTLVSVRAPVGDINMANEECCVGRGVAAVRHKTGVTSFTYHSMASLYPDFARFEAEGTVFGSINKQSFESLPFVIPSPEIVAAYERRAAPLDDEIRTLENQSRTLAAIRDSLLPKLLSGSVGLGMLSAPAG